MVSPVLLPNLVSKKPSQSYDVGFSKSIRIGGFVLYSHTTCITPTASPDRQESEVAHLALVGSNLLKKNITIAPGKLPALAKLSTLDKPVTTKGSLTLKLEHADMVFGYRLVANSNVADCNKQSTSLICDVAPLKLLQSKEYSLSLQRFFRNTSSDIVFQKSIQTVEPIRVISSSIATDQTIYDTPTTLTVTLDRAISSLENIQLQHISGDTKKDIPHEVTPNGSTLTIELKEPLPRNASMLLAVNGISAEDGGYLTEPFIVPFKVSGGPKVVGINIGSYKVAVASSITLTFDSAPSSAQSLGDFVHIETSSGVVAALATMSGKTVSINPVTDLPRCTSFTVKVLDGLKNEFGIAGGSAWQFKSRTICQTTFSIGTSVQGRSITGYIFGSGSSKIIFIGAVHGNEKSSTYLLNKWIEALEAGYERIPANRSIVVIPNLNPDGYVANRRTNANNVDLNRNFPSNDWKSGVSMPDGSYLEHGGGVTALSEPESQAIATYIQNNSPRLVLTYHAAASIVSPNDAGDSKAIASAYADKSPVGYVSNSASSSYFKYDTTGAFETWLHDKRSTPALIIELASKTSNSEFSGHQNALWYIAQLP